MNYQILKSIIDNLITNFSCPSCESGIGEQNLEIVWAAGNTLNVSITCPSCKKNAMIKTEVAHIHMGNIDSANPAESIQEKINLLKWELKKWNVLWEVPHIKDEQITDLNRKLKNISWVSDLFDEK